MKYVMVYFDDEYLACDEETKNFAIYQVSVDETQMRCYYQILNNEVVTYKDDYWFKNLLTNKIFKTLTEEEVFMHCL